MVTDITRRFARRILPLLAVTLLAACAEMPQLSLGVMGPNYKPISSEVAEMAAPRAPQAEETAAPAWRTLYCRVDRGTVRIGKYWQDFTKTDFTISPAAPSHVDLSARQGQGSTAFNAYFDTDGQKVIFCPVKNAPAGAKISCSSMYVLDDDLEAGVKRTFDIPDAVRGGSISCAYDTAALKI